MGPHLGLTLSERRTTLKVMRTQAIVDERGQDYGDPKDNHARTAALWSTYLGVPISPTQVCMANILQKISRTMGPGGPTQDSLEDIAGYAANALSIEHE